MDFYTCLWSKDAQHKRRKRWTDGVAHFCPATGHLSVWDEDESTRVGIARLKADEATTVLQGRGDEVRLGPVSLQILAAACRPGTSPIKADGKEPPRTLARVDHTSAAGLTSEVLDESGERVGSSTRRIPGSARRGCLRRLSRNGDANTVDIPPAMAGQPAGQKRARLAPRVSRTTVPVVHSDSGMAALEQSRECPQERASVADERASAGDAHSTVPTVSRRAFKRPASIVAPQLPESRTHQPSPLPSMKSASARSAFLTDGSGANAPNAGGCGGRGLKRMGLVGGGRGPSSGPRFQAPRVRGAETAGETVREIHDRRSGVQASRATDPRGNAQPGGRTLGRISASGSTAASLKSSQGSIHPEDLVLEWTEGEHSEPLLAGASLARRLHPHQREGLKVLWDCLAGRGGFDGRGAILADEMGLGKTATAIALCTCVLRHRRRECRKAVVVCPSSLVKNWVNEFRKWCPLGGGAVAVDQAGVAAAQLVADFNIGAPARYPILVISYELYRNHGNTINATGGLGLLIADEGHRLKNSSETKTTRALRACPAQMRLVLTGTPMQNNLDEFYAVADFVNPGLLGDIRGFRSRYTRPIRAACDRGADEGVQLLAEERARELGDITGKFVLRRTKDVLRGSIPPAVEVVVFCRPSERQLGLYQEFVATSSAKALVSDCGAPAEATHVGLHEVLPLISALRRLCNHPDLVKKSSSAKAASTGERQRRDDPEDSDDGDGVPPSRLVDEDNAEGRKRPAWDKENMIKSYHGNGRGRKSSWNGSHEAARGVAPGLQVLRVEGKAREAKATSALQVSEYPVAKDAYLAKDSGKVLVLRTLLRFVRRCFPKDKVVVTSNSTSALDVLCRLAERNCWGLLRLDGSTASSARQSLVDRFNRASPDDVFVFFLSAKAGGVGLNLTGANRIVLFDSDWNPATDEQAMARVWRLGQTKRVSMYRLITTGTIEESVYQRQIFKGALYDVLHDVDDATDGTSCIRDGHETAAIGIDRRANERRRRHRDGGGGFSQEELKELFVLKLDTKSDTFDKLRRRGSPGRLPDDSRHPDRLPVDGGSWDDYTGSSSIRDEALRRALEENGPQGSRDCDDLRSGDADSTVANVVTFVREVRRGESDMESVQPSV